MLLQVLEKSSSGWWFVRRGQDEGWVPEAYLMQENAADSQVRRLTMDPLKLWKRQFGGMLPKFNYKKS